MVDCMKCQSQKNLWQRQTKGLERIESQQWVIVSNTNRELKELILFFHFNSILRSLDISNTQVDQIVINGIAVIWAVDSEYAN